MKLIHGKRALITGAASGIGREIALALARQGTHVYLMDIDAARVAQTAEEARQHGVEAIGVQCDLSDAALVSASVREMLRRWKTLDILVNNAGVAYFGPTHCMSADQWEHLLRVNLHAPIQLIRELLPTLRLRGQSHIVNVGSVAGLVAGRKMAAYNATKFGLQGLTESLRAELARFGVGVSAVCPGFIDTSLFDNCLNGQGKRGVRRPPTWMMTTPDVVARQTVQAIRRNSPLVVVTPTARLLWLLKRLWPRTFMRLAGWRFSRRRMVKTPASAEYLQPGVQFGLLAAEGPGDGKKAA